MTRDLGAGSFGLKPNALANELPTFSFSSPAQDRESFLISTDQCRLGSM